jgi:hypothetical protein
MKSMPVKRCGIIQKIMDIHVNGIALIKKQGRPPEFPIDASRDGLIAGIDNLGKGVLNIQIEICS